ncbi:MAG: MFS transporter [Anaerolineaceae bacterium]|nr:MFS transporter [Anaerolineaceae bacterium]
MTTQTNVFSNEAKLANWRPHFVWLEGIFYFFQGFYLTGVSTFLGVTMAGWNMDLARQASLSAMIGLPSYLKMFIGLLTDRVPFARFGRRKPYIVIGAFLYIPAFAAFIWIKDYSVLWLLAALSTQIAWVLVDTTLDAMTVDVTPEEYSGQMQGAAQSARSIGMGLGVLVVPLIGPKLGWTNTIALIALFALIQSAAAILIRELPIGREDLKAEMNLGKVLKDTFGKKLVWSAAVFAMFFMGSIGVSSLIRSYMLTTLGWSQSETMMRVFGISNLLQYLGAAAGAALIGGLASKYKDNYKFYWIVSGVFWVSVLPWLLVSAEMKDVFWVYAAQLSFGVGMGFMRVLTYSVVMRVCPKSVEGFMFATLTSAMNIGLYTITPNTIAFFEPKVGVIGALFTTIPYTVIGLLALGLILSGLKQREARKTPAPEEVVA